MGYISLLKTVFDFDHHHHHSPNLFGIDETRRPVYLLSNFTISRHLSNTSFLANSLLLVLPFTAIQKEPIMKIYVIGIRVCVAQESYLLRDDSSPSLRVTVSYVKLFGNLFTSLSLLSKSLLTVFYQKP